MKSRKVLKGKKPRKISSQRKVCTAKSFVHVSPLSFPFVTVGSFLQKIIPSLVPLIECCGEFLTGCFRKCEGESAEFFSCLKLWITCEFLRDGLQLVKLTLLNGNLRKPLLEYLSNTFPTIDGKGLESETRGYEVVETLVIIFHLLTRNFLPVQIPSIRSANQHTICPAKKRCIHNQIHWLFFYDDFSGCSGMSIEVFANRFWIFSIRFFKISVGLASLGVIIVGICYPCRRLFVLTNEDVFTCLALVSLPTRLSAIFLD